MYLQLHFSQGCFCIVLNIPTKDILHGWFQALELIALVVVGA